MSLVCRFDSCCGVLQIHLILQDDIEQFVTLVIGRMSPFTVHLASNLTEAVLKVRYALSVGLLLFLECVVEGWEGMNFLL